jgi:hypothetical protein
VSSIIQIQGYSAKSIANHIPVWDKSARSDGTFSRADFVFDSERNIYLCPGGAKLTSTGNIDQGHIVYHRASKSDCSTCSLKPKCTTAIVRKNTRDLNEQVRDQVRILANTDAFHQSRRGAQEGRDAICAHEALPQARPASLARLERGKGRSAVDRNRAELEASCQTPLPSPTDSSCSPGVSVAARTISRKLPRAPSS